jgi:hypothetical protein
MEYDIHLCAVARGSCGTPSGLHPPAYRVSAAITETVKRRYALANDHSARSYLPAHPLILRRIGGIVQRAPASDELEATTAATVSDMQVSAAGGRARRRFWTFRLWRGRFGGSLEHPKLIGCTTLTRWPGS